MMSPLPPAPTPSTTATAGLLQDSSVSTDDIATSGEASSTSNGVGDVNADLRSPGHHVRRATAATAQRVAESVAASAAALDQEIEQERQGAMRANLIAGFSPKGKAGAAAGGLRFIGKASRPRKTTAKSEAADAPNVDTDSDSGK